MIGLHGTQKKNENYTNLTGIFLNEAIYLQSQRTIAKPEKYYYLGTNLISICLEEIIIRT